MIDFRKVAQYRDVAAIAAQLTRLGLELPIDSTILTAADGSPLAAPLALFGSGARRLIAGNRWCIHPMEGWDAQRDGRPTDETLRRWRRFGESGAKLIWGGEAAAVRPDGRANPNQTMAIESNREGLKRLLETLRDGHRSIGEGTDDLVVGLQLTHSGRFSRPNDRTLEPTIAWPHPILDRRCGIADAPQLYVLQDDRIPELIADFVRAARLAADVGFDFVDIKACHGYLLHEFLGAHERPGPYGGDFDGRTRLLLEIVRAVREQVPSIAIGVRLNAFDCVAWERFDEASRPVPHDELKPYRWGFAIDRERPTEYDLSETIALLERLKQSGVIAVNLTGGTPYTAPHWQRPAAFPPTDGYPPPEDPLAGVVRHLQVGRVLKQAVPDLPLIGSGYTYLQDYLPQVAQAAVREGWIDGVGIGRMVLSHPELPQQTLRSGTVERKLVCRTFSDCTSAPRNGLISGCYPLDDHYRHREERERLNAAKRRAAGKSD
ncbi:MAG TPA: NADH:flavin oxidoreductase [Pirellulaceae bacterium]|nr:NADH:flavin oxidoreductase [Pirellulaceae bacterium]